MLKSDTSVTGQAFKDGPFWQGELRSIPPHSIFSFGKMKANQDMLSLVNFSQRQTSIIIWTLFKRKRICFGIIIYPRAVC